MPGVMTKATKRAPLRLKSGAATGEIAALFSTFGVVDKDNDVVLASAFTDGQACPMCWSHDWTKPIGKGTIRVTPFGAEFHGRLFTDTTAGLDAYRTIKNMGELQEYSWGFEVLDSEYGQQDGRRVRYIKAARLREVSPVLVGAGEGTRTLAIKQARADQRSPWRREPVLDPLPPPGTYRFREHESDVVSSRQLLAAIQALKACCADLDLPPLIIKWFDEVDYLDREDLATAKVYGWAAPFTTWDADGDRSGSFSPFDHDAVWVRVGLDERETVLTVAHELRHAWQFREHGRAHGSEQKALYEEDADAYEASLESRCA